MISLVKQKQCEAGYGNILKTQIMIKLDYAENISEITI